jgi:hypothetical protein
MGNVRREKDVCRRVVKDTNGFGVSDEKAKKIISEDWSKKYDKQ